MVPLLFGCSKTESPKERLTRLIDGQNLKYLEEANQQIRSHLPPGTVDQYVFESTYANFETGPTGKTEGHVYVLFEKKGTRVKKKTGPKSYSVKFDSLQVNFESFDTYRCIEFMITEDGKSEIIEVFVEHFPEGEAD